MASQTKLQRRHRRLRRLRQSVQVISFLVFVALIAYGVQPSVGLDRVALLMRLDPLAGISSGLATRRILTAFWPAAIMLLLSLILGRFWCGWLCPLGSLIDWVAPRRASQKKVGGRWRTVKYVLLFLTIFGALWGSLTLLALDPLSIFTRAISTVALPSFSWLLSRIQALLYQTGRLDWMVTALDQFTRNALPGYGQAYYAGTLLAIGLLVAILGLNWVALRFWCRYLCPLGSLYALLGKISWLKRQVTMDCIVCARCKDACPMGTIDGEREYASDSGECILCYDCAAECPTDAIAFQGQWQPEDAWPYDPNRRHALGALGGSLAGLALMRVSADRREPNPYRLRPPGVDEDDMLTRCIRCGACMRVCPTHGLQPSVTEAGWEGVITPVLVPRLGQCDYTCNACGQVCPTGAIPQLSLEEKRQTPIGKAYVDESLCIAWSGRAPCVVCEEMCPIPGKAIELEEQSFTRENGETYSLQVPVVRHEQCIGCGLCEQKCPVQGSAAIRVRLDPLGF